VVALELPDVWQLNPQGFFDAKRVLALSRVLRKQIGRGAQYLPV